MAGCDEIPSKYPVVKEQMRALTVMTDRGEKYSFCSGEALRMLLKAFY